MAATLGDLSRALARPAQLRAGVWVLAVVALAACAVWPTSLALVRIWGEMADYEHGYLIGSVALVWLVRLRQRIDGARPQSSWPALSALVIAVLAWLIAFRGSSELLQQVLLPAILLLTVAATAGLKIALLVAPPVAYLYFAVPIWEYAVPPLQTLTAWAAEGALALLQVPASFQGVEVTIPSGRFTIAEDCAGKRYLVIGLASATLAAAMQSLSARRVALLLVATAALAMLANWLRVSIIIYLGHITQMQHYLVAVEHITFGWFVFVPLLAAIFYVARRLGRGAPGRAQQASPPGLPALPAAPARWWIAAILLVPLLATTTSQSTPAQASLGSMPVRTDDWQGPFPSSAGFSPRFEGAHEQRQAAYRSARGTVHVYLNLYQSQSQGRELVFYSNSMTGEGWSPVAAALEIDAPADAQLSVARDASGQQWVLMRTYNVGGSTVASPLAAQLGYGARALLRPVPSGVIVLASPCLDGCDAAAESVTLLWREMGSVLVGLLEAR